MERNKDVPFEAHFLEGARGRLFGLYFPAIGTPCGKLLCLPPFTEESNRCRVMLGMAARALARRGWATLILDPFGCGDSSGDFEEAEWSGWQQDIDTGIDWLSSRPGPLTLWGTRLSAIMVAEAASRQLEEVANLLFWQPVINGKQAFTQYLRLRVANSLELFGKQETTKELRQRLAEGETLEIGGYYITPTLAADLDTATMPTFENIEHLTVHWLERVEEEDAELMPPSRRQIEAWRNAGIRVKATPFEGPPFWQLHERFLAPQLIEKTVTTLEASR